jgi:hypothetical protein
MPSLRDSTSGTCRVDESTPPPRPGKSSTVVENSQRGEGSRKAVVKVSLLQTA